MWSWIRVFRDYFQRRYHLFSFRSRRDRRVGDRHVGSVSASVAAFYANFGWEPTCIDWKPTRLDWTPAKSTPARPLELPEAHFISQGLDPLIAASYHNLTVSPLCRLPDELVLQIMELVDFVGLHCLLRTSRTFLRLFGSSSFEAWHRKGASQPLSLWPDIPYGPDQIILLALLQKDCYCAPCLRVRHLGREHQGFRALVDQQLYCGSCRTNHPAGLFSAAQRRAKNDQRLGSRHRKCIAHEGHIRVCQHVVIQWSDMVELGTRVELGTTDERHDSMFVPLGPICKDVSHGPPCNPRIPPWRDGTEIAGWVRKDWKGRILVDIQWIAHVAPRPPTSEPLTAEAIRQVVELTYQDAGQFLTSQIPEGRSALAATFDPNICSCAQYVGHDRLDWQLSKGNSCCHSDASLHMSTPTAVAAQILEHTAFRPSGTLDNGSFCGHLGRCDCNGWTVSYYRRIDAEIPQPSRPCRPDDGWYRAIDPESYHLDMDQDSCHILWCPDDRCGNYYGRYNERRFAYMLSRQRYGGET